MLFLFSCFLLFSRANGLFWDLLNCPLCYLPRVDWGTPYYQPATPAYAPVVESVPAQVVAQTVRQVVQQPVQQVQYVYKRPIVKYIQPVKYVYLPQQQQVLSPPAAASYQAAPSYISQTPLPPYHLSQTELTNRRYNSGADTYSTGTSAVFETADQAPIAHKLPSSLGRNAKKSKGKGRVTTTTTPKTTDEDELVEFEDAQSAEKEKPKHDISERKKTFHIHEDIEGAGKQPESPKGITSNVIPDGDDSLEDLDILTTDEHSKPSDKEDSLGKKSPDMIAMSQKKEMIAVIPKTRNEFIPIGKDKKKTSISDLVPTQAPENLRKEYGEDGKLNELVEAFEEKKAAKPSNPF